MQNEQSSYDLACLGLRNLANSAALESRHVDGLNQALLEIKKVNPYFIPAPLRPYANLLQIPFSANFVTPHSHPLHAAYRNQWHLNLASRYITTPSTVVSCTLKRFSILSDACSVPLLLSNMILSPRDESRYAPNTRCSPANRFPSLTTPGLVLPESLHYYSLDDIYRIYCENPVLETIVASAIIPPESLTGQYSEHPALYTFTTRDDTLIYAPEGDLSNTYEQPLSGGIWLTHRAFHGPKFSLCIERVESKFSFHTFIISSKPLLVPRFATFFTSDCFPLPKYRRSCPHAGQMVPCFLLRSLYLYGKSLKKWTDVDMYAKARQFKGVLDDATLSLSLLNTVVDFVIFLLTLDLSDASDPVTYFSVGGMIKYHTYGWFKHHTAVRIRNKFVAKFAHLLDDHERGRVFPLLETRVSGTVGNVIFGDPDALRQSNGIGFFTSVFRRVLGLKISPNTVSGVLGVTGMRYHADWFTTDRQWDDVFYTCGARLSSAERRLISSPHVMKGDSMSFFIASSSWRDESESTLSLLPFDNVSLDSLSSPNNYTCGGFSPPLIVASAPPLRFGGISFDRPPPPVVPFSYEVVVNDDPSSSALYMDVSQLELPAIQSFLFGPFQPHDPCFNFTFSHFVPCIDYSRPQPPVHHYRASTRAIMTNITTTPNDLLLPPPSSGFGSTLVDRRNALLAFGLASACVPAVTAPPPPPLPVVVQIARSPSPQPRKQILAFTQAKLAQKFVDQCRPSQVLSTLKPPTLILVEPSVAPCRIYDVLPEVTVTNASVVAVAEDLVEEEVREDAPFIRVDEVAEVAVAHEDGCKCVGCLTGRDITPCGGARSFHVTAGETEIAFRLIGVEKYIPRSLPLSSYLDRAFPMSQGKRHNNTLLGLPSPVSRKDGLLPAVTKQDCLLVCLSAITGVSKIGIWNVICQLCPSVARAELLKLDSFLSVYHLESASLYFHLNVHLIAPRGSLGKFPKRYGVNEGKLFRIDFNGKDHFSYTIENQVWSASPRVFEQRMTSSAPQTSEGCRLRNELKLRALHGFEYRSYTASWQRAEGYVRALRDGSTGTLLAIHKEEYVKCLESAAEGLLKTEKRRVRLAVVTGDAGCGKSYPVQRVLMDKKWQRNHLFTVVVPSVVLRAEWATALGFRDPCFDGKGTPQEYCLTFETALSGTSEVVIIDEIGKYPPGYVDLLIGLNPFVHTVICLGDNQQTVWHEPKECLLNNSLVWRPEIEHFMPYADCHLRGSRRTSRSVSTFFGTQTSNPSSAGFRFRRQAQPNIFTVCPSKNVVDAAVGLLGNVSCTFNSSQGITVPEVQIIINRTCLTFPSNRNFYTACTRSTGAVYIVFDVVDCNETYARLADNPILNALWSLRDLPDDAPITHALCPLGPMFENEMSGLPLTYRNALPLEKVVNAKDLPIGSFAAPSGGYQAESLYGDFRTPLAYWSNLNAVPEVQVVVPEPFVLEPLNRVHLPAASAVAFRELITSQIPDRYDQEMTDAHKYGLMSVQKFDGSILRRDWVAQAKFDGTPLHEARDDPRYHVDVDRITPYHQMSAKDSVALKAGIKKRITFDNPAANLSALFEANTFVGPSLFSALQRAIPFLTTIVPFNASLAEECMLENEENRAKTKGSKSLQNFRARAEPEWPINFLDLSAKNEIKAKDEKRFKEAIALQTLVTAHDYIFHRMGWVARYITAQILPRLPPYLLIYLRKSPADLDAWCKRFWVDKTSSWNDFTAFDQGQDASFLSMEVALMNQLSLPRSEIDFYVWLKTNTYSRLGGFSIMRFTGEVFTFLFNTLANVAISFLRYDLDGMVCAFGGDDSCINGVPTERPEWQVLSPYLKLQFKAESGLKPSFVSWYLTSFGILKSPVLLYTRLQMQMSRGLFAEVALSYLYEFSFGYRLGDRVTSFLTEEEQEAQSLLVSFFQRSKFVRPHLHILSDGMDSPNNEDPAFYSRSWFKLDLDILKQPAYLVNALIASISNNAIPFSTLTSAEAVALLEEDSVTPLDDDL
jgi:hypothetical protein